MAQIGKRRADVGMDAARRSSTTYQGVSLLFWTLDELKACNRQEFEGAYRSLTLGEVRQQYDHQGIGDRT